MLYATDIKINSLQSCHKSLAKDSHVFHNPHLKPLQPYSSETADVADRVHYAQMDSVHHLVTYITYTHQQCMKCLLQPDDQLHKRNTD